MDGRRRGSLPGLLLGVAILVFGAVVGLSHRGVSGLVWTIAGAVLLGYNAWALLRRSGGRPPREFPMPDPVQEEEERASVRARLDELEKQYRGGTIGYETYVRRRMEIITGSGR